MRTRNARAWLLATLVIVNYGLACAYAGERMAALAGDSTRTIVGYERLDPGGLTALQDLDIGPVIQYANATYTGPPSCREMVVPSINATVPQFVCAIVRRPEGGGGLTVLTLLTANGTFLNIGLDAASYQDCFGGSPWASRFSGTIKVYLNCKTPNDPDGNKRDLFPINTGVPATPVDQ